MAFVTDSCGQALLFLSGVCCPSIIPTGVKHAGYDGFRPANAIFFKKKKKVMVISLELQKCSLTRC